MAFMDKMIEIDKLKSLGWKDGPKEYHFVPPEDLWANKPESFYVYDARDLQNLLCRPNEEESGAAIDVERRTE